MPEHIAGEHSLLYTPAQMELLMERMAADLAGVLVGAEKIAMVGVLRRGAPLAEKLTNLLVARHGFVMPLRLDLSVKRYADDLTLLHPETKLSGTESLASLDLAGYTVVVIDDVLYQGHSLLRVTEWLAKKNPAVIRAACLVDRCTNVLPVKLDVVGARLQVSPSSVIECHVPPYEEAFQIVLVNRVV